MLNNVWRHVYRVAGANWLLLNLTGSGFPLDNALPAEYEIDFLKIRGVFDFDTLVGVLIVLVPVMRAVARRNFIYVEKKFLGGDDSSDLPSLLGQATYVLRPNLIGLYDF